MAALREWEKNTAKECTHVDLASPSRSNEPTITMQHHNFCSSVEFLVNSCYCYCMVPLRVLQTAANDEITTKTAEHWCNSWLIPSTKRAHVHCSFWNRWLGAKCCYWFMCNMWLNQLQWLVKSIVSHLRVWFPDIFKEPWKVETSRIVQGGRGPLCSNPMTRIENV